MMANSEGQTMNDRKKDSAKFNADLVYDLATEAKAYNLVDDSLLLQAISPDLDIFDMYSDFSGEPIGLSEYLLPRPDGHDLPFGPLYGVPKAKWEGFQKFIEGLRISHNGKQYGPFLIKGKMRDTNTRANKYPIRDLVTVYLVSVIDLTTSRILRPLENSTETQWYPFKVDDTERSRRRSPISREKRFEILQRDGFRCYYCKKHKDDFPPGVELTLDHKVPRSQGGDDSFENLVAACSECNRGKSDKIFGNV
jgi:5-methylcytosine-specific restriction endonuclease McrA